MDEFQLAKKYEEQGYDLANIFRENEVCRGCPSGQYINLDNNFDVLCLAQIHKVPKDEMKCMLLNKSTRS